MVGRGEKEADAGGLLDEAVANLEQAQPQGGELCTGEWPRAGNGVAQGEHQPVGWTLGRAQGRRLSSVMAGVAFALLGEEDARTANSYPMATAYATSATSKSYPPRIIRVKPTDWTPIGVITR